MIKNILLLDNYDSFTFNLHHYLEKLGAAVTVIRNDALKLEDAAIFDALVLSPGPGLPEQAGCMMQLIQQFFTSKPILGVCLGHQALAVATGGSLLQLPGVLHGVSSQCKIIETQTILYNQLPKQFQIGHYHSWVIDPQTLSSEWIVTAQSNELVMSISHRNLPVHGVQFHPESVLTEYGLNILGNWLNSF